MFERIAYCGMDCSKCPVYQATHANDQKMKIRCARLLSTDLEPFQPEDVHCEGCTQREGQLLKMCANCKVRNCAMERGIRNCAWCADYPCNVLVAQYQNPACRHGRSRLDEIRKDLVA